MVMLAHECPLPAIQNRQVLECEADQFRSGDGPGKCEVHPDWQWNYRPFIGVDGLRRRRGFDQLESLSRRSEAVEGRAVAAEESGEGIAAGFREKIRARFFKRHRIELRGTATGVAPGGAAALGSLGGVRGAVGSGKELGLSRRQDRITQSGAVVLKLHDGEAVKVILQSLNEMTYGVEEMLRCDGSPDVRWGLTDKLRCFGRGDMFTDNAKVGVLIENSW